MQCAKKKMEYNVVHLGLGEIVFLHNFISNLQFLFLFGSPAVQLLRRGRGSVGGWVWGGGAVGPCSHGVPKGPTY